MIVARAEVGGEAIQAVGEEATMAEGEDLWEGEGAEVALEVTLGEVSVRVIKVVGQVLGAVLGTMQWVSLAEDTVTVEVVEAVVEGLEETWEVLEVVIEASEVGEVVGEEDKVLGASRWIRTTLEELLAPSTLIRLRRTKAQLKPLRCKDNR